MLQNAVRNVGLKTVRSIVSKGVKYIILRMLGNCAFWGSKECHCEGGDN